MLKNLRKDQRGFTIIEVLIVLAIAGLIMLIVFLAVPALQRNQRNNARNSEASRISSAVTECLANRNGVTSSCQTLEALSIGSTGAGEEGNTLNGYQQFTDVSFTDEEGGEEVAGTESTVNVDFGRTCNADGSSTVASDNARDFVVTYQREPAVNRCIGSESN